MPWFTVALSLGALALSVRALWVNHRWLKEREEHKALSSTMADILDAEGQVRGQLALPGEVTTLAVSARVGALERRTKALDQRAQELNGMFKEAQKELSDAWGREKGLEQTLANVVGVDGVVLAQIRLPGTRCTPPDTTPCGNSCGHAHQDDARRWVCKVGMDIPCVAQRRQFLGSDSQCTHFKPASSWGNEG